MVEPALHQKKLSQRQLGGPRALLVKATTNTTCVIILPPPCASPFLTSWSSATLPQVRVQDRAKAPHGRKKKWVPGPGNPLVAQMVKNLPAKVQSLGQEHPLEMGMATHSSIRAWRIQWTEASGRLQSMGSQRVGHD